jgi:enediyne biosynthesis protein E4
MFSLVAAAALAAATAPFEDMSTRAGIAFLLRNDATPSKHQIETMPGGVAAFDYDNDGRVDLYFVNGARQPELRKTDSGYFNRLYRNLGHWRFEDVTERAGVQGEGFGMAVAAADYDNDGFTDLFVAGVNRNILYRNIGDGQFVDVTVKAGLASRGEKPWSIAAGWFDYDNDGRLDLFVVNYVQWDPAKEPFCGDPKGTYRTYCHPKHYTGLSNLLYHNNGNGTFTDVSAASGISAHIGKGMGLAFADYDDDGRMDVFVANDTEPNLLFHNEGNGRFTEVGMKAGIGFNDDGRALSSMGVDFRDLDNDGRPDLFITALANETFPLYRNLGKGLFADLTYPSRIGAATMACSGWGAGIYDFDNDGWKDLFTANGDVHDNTEVFSSRKSRQQNLLFLNSGKGSFAAQPIGSPAMHRGAAFADLDGDGRIDVVVTQLQGQPVLLRNTMGEGRHWLGVRLAGVKSSRDGVGAKVRVVCSSGKTQWNHATTSVGYASSSDRVVHFGLGTDNSVRLLEVVWPSGTVQRIENIAVDRYLDLTEP